MDPLPLALTECQCSDVKKKHYLNFARVDALLLERWCGSRLPLASIKILQIMNPFALKGLTQLGYTNQTGCSFMDPLPVAVPEPKH